MLYSTGINNKVIAQTLVEQMRVNKLIKVFFRYIDLWLLKTNIVRIQSIYNYYQKLINSILFPVWSGITLPSHAILELYFDQIYLWKVAALYAAYTGAH